MPSVEFGFALVGDPSGFVNGRLSSINSNASIEEAYGLPTKA